MLTEEPREVVSRDNSEVPPRFYTDDAATHRDEPGSRIIASNSI